MKAISKTALISAVHAGIFSRKHFMALGRSHILHVFVYMAPTLTCHIKIQTKEVERLHYQ